MNENKEQQPLPPLVWDAVKMDKPFLVSEEVENAYWAFVITLSGGVGQVILPFAMVKQMFLDGGAMIEQREQELQKEEEKQEEE